MKFELDPERSEHSFWELDQFEHDSSHPDGAFCVPVLHSEREWQVCLLLYFFLYSVVVLCTDARFQTAWNGMLHQGLVHIQLWSNFNVFQMCLVVGGCSSAVRNTMKVATRLQDAARCFKLAYTQHLLDHAKAFTHSIPRFPLNPPSQTCNTLEVLSLFLWIMHQPVISDQLLNQSAN